MSAYERERDAIERKKTKRKRERERRERERAQIVALAQIARGRKSLILNCTVTSFKTKENFTVVFLVYERSPRLKSVGAEKFFSFLFLCNFFLFCVFVREMEKVIFTARNFRKQIKFVVEKKTKVFFPYISVENLSLLNFFGILNLHTCL